MEEPAQRHDVALYLLRHGHAGDPAGWDGADEARPLSDKGRRQAEKLAAYMAGRGFSPDSIISSTKLRALQTAELLAEPLGLPVTQDQRLAGPLDVDGLAAVLDAAGGRKVVVVGHDPDFSELAATLCGASYLPLKKGALCRLDVSLPLQPGGGILRWLLPPELLPD